MTGQLTLKTPPVNPTDAASKSYVDATAGGALAYSGMQINGSMEVSQERGTTNYTLVNQAASYVQDGWIALYNSSTASMVAYPAYTASAPPGYQSSLVVQSGVGAAMAAADYFVLMHYIEGYRVSRLAWGTSNAQPVTLGFWLNTTIAGTMALTIRNSAGNRFYIADVAINSPNTWEYKTVTIPGDTAGTWLKTNGSGLQVLFCFASGANNRGTPLTWGAGGAFATASTTNFIASNGNNTYIAGLVVLPGTQAPTAAQSPLIMRPYDQELVTCKRYWQKLGGSYGAGADVYLRAYTTAGLPLYTTLTYPVEMRAPPTAAVAGAWGFINTSALVINTAGTKSISIGVVATGTGDTAAYTNATTTYISLDARL